MAVRGVAPRFTVQEYLALEAVAEIKHEYIGGDIIGMAGAEPEHNQIAQNLRLLLGNALADRPCRILGSDQRVYVESVGEYYYPDVVVSCGQATYVEPKPRSITNPELVIEVMSASTARYDRGEKSTAYRTIPSLTDYVIVESTRREVEHYQRQPDGSWSVRTLRDRGAVTLSSGVALDFEAIYRLV